MKRLGTTIAAGLLAATSAQAQFFSDGEIAFHFLESDGTDWHALSGDFTLGYRFDDIWSFEIGLDGSRTRFDSGFYDSTYMAFATITATTDIGRFQIGRPRLVIEDYFEAADFVSDYATKYYFPTFFHSMAFEDIYLDANNFHGLRYDGQWGNTRVGASVTQETDGTTDTYLQFALTHQIDVYTLGVGLERETTDDETSAYFSAVGDWGRFGGSLLYRTYDDGSGFRGEFYNAGMDFDITERLNIELMYSTLASFGDTWKSATLTYDITDNAYVALSGGDFNLIDDPLYSLTFGWRLDY
ncbi:hypothetical protein [uncultured Shimia sp.]|uniref:hypothetical protein n=1 Tax=uncultured Shimia sp. TaxID=573152 RepID=UPI002608DCEA|nr:hypothetical protein [uncultured Shimia sp.]